MPSVPQNPHHPTENLAAPWLSHYPAGVPHTLDYPDEPVWWFLEVAGHYHPQRAAICYYEQQLTYTELLEAARRTASLLARLGVQPGDRVALLMPNIPECLIALFGTWMAGAVVVSLSPLMVAEEVSSLIAATQCRVVISLDLLAPLVRDSVAKPEHLLLVSLRQHLSLWNRVGYSVVLLKRMGFHFRGQNIHIASFADELAQSDPSFHGIRVPKDAPAFILPTGGTTGSPKAVVLSHKNVVANAWQLFHWGGSAVGKEIFLCVLPFFHSYGMSACAATGVAMAATLVLHHRFDPEVILGLIEKQRPTIFHAVPAMFAELNNHLRPPANGHTGHNGNGSNRNPPPKHWDLSSLKFCISGGAPLDPAIAQEFARHTGATVVEGFGLSEASPVTHTGPLDGTARPGTIGLPLPDTEARIVDAETGLVTLPPGEVGELVIRGPQVMLGYWNKTEETARTIRDGWLFTGDLATRDADGFFKIVDRKKDLIITSGFNVYPNDVEYVLRKYPGVTDVGVIGVPDPEKGEIVKALLVLEKSARFDRKAFDRFTAEHLAKHKRPRLVEVVPTLPRSFLGKVVRRKLREQPAAPDAGSLVPKAIEPAATAE